MFALPWQVPQEVLQDKNPLNNLGWNSQTKDKYRKLISFYKMFFKNVYLKNVCLEMLAISKVLDFEIKKFCNFQDIKQFASFNALFV